MFSISFEDFACAVDPVHGGAVFSFVDQTGDILRAGSADDDPRDAACFPCVPWFGRIYGDLVFQGSRHVLAPTLPACDADHALHGDGWVSAWEVARHTDDALALRLDCGGWPSTHARKAPGAAKSGYPFGYAASQRFSLSRAGLTIALSLTNTGDGPMPAGLGLHPYFSRTAATRVRFSAQKMWTPPSQGPGRLGPLPGGLGGGASAKLPDTTLDHSFVGVGGKVSIAGAGREIVVAADAPIIHIYAPAGESFFCVEPITHLPGELTRAASGYGGRTLAPGETMNLTLTISPS